MYVGSMYRLRSINKPGRIDMRKGCCDTLAANGAFSQSSRSTRARARRCLCTWTDESVSGCDEDYLIRVLMGELFFTHFIRLPRCVLACMACVCVCHIFKSICELLGSDR